MDFSTPKSAAARPPKETWAERGKAISEHLAKGIAADVADDIHRSRWAQLDERVAEAIDGGKENTIDDLLVDFEKSFSDAIHWERQNGRLRPWRAADEIEKHLAAFAKWRYPSRIIDYLRAQLQLGELIISVEARSVVTSLRTWTLDQMKNGCRMVTERSDSNFERQFLSESQIDALVVEDAKNARPAEAPWASANRSALGPQ